MALTVDGAIAADVRRQLQRLPPDATHLVVSAGGNDALSEIGILHEPVTSVAEALAVLHAAQGEFRKAYEAILRTVLALDKPTVLCTIYDAVPDLEAPAKTALNVFNEVILRSACSAGLPVIDLRLVCTQASDYSPLSSIEPSVTGGAKIARVIATTVPRHDFTARHTVIYA